MIVLARIATIGEIFGKICLKAIVNTFPNMWSANRGNRSMKEWGRDSDFWCMGGGGGGEGGGGGGGGRSRGVGILKMYGRRGESLVPLPLVENRQSDGSIL